MERFKDAQSTSSVPRMISVSFFLTFSTHGQVMNVNASYDLDDPLNSHS